MKTNTNLKRFFFLTTSSLLLFSLLASGTFTVQAQTGFESKQSSAEREYFCSIETLEGRYAVIGDGFAAPPPHTLLPFATVSLMTLDGEGNLTNKVTRSNNGFISRGLDVGTYAVNPDCTGTITIATPAPPFQLTFDLVIAEIQGAKHAREFYFIATTPGGAVTATAKRIQ